jgi:hypothetical protein
MIIIVVVLAATLSALTSSSNATVFGIPKNNIIIADVALAFILGYMLGRPGRQSRLKHIPEDNEHTNSDTLSEEDRNYIG